MRWALRKCQVGDVPGGLRKQHAKIHKYINTQIHKYTSTQVHKYTEGGNVRQGMCPAV